MPTFSQYRVQEVEAELTRLIRDYGVLDPEFKVYVTSSETAYTHLSIKTSLICLYLNLPAMSIRMPVQSTARELYLGSSVQGFMKDFFNLQRSRAPVLKAETVAGSPAQRPAFLSPRPNPRGQFLPEPEPVSDWTWMKSLGRWEKAEPPLPLPSKEVIKEVLSPKVRRLIRE